MPQSFFLIPRFKIQGTTKNTGKSEKHLTIDKNIAVCKTEPHKPRRHHFVTGNDKALIPRGLKTFPNM